MEMAYYPHQATSEMFITNKSWKEAEKNDIDVCALLDAAGFDTFIDEDAKNWIWWSGDRSYRDETIQTMLRKLAPYIEEGSFAVWVDDEACERTWGYRVKNGDVELFEKTLNYKELLFGSYLNMSAMI